MVCIQILSCVQRYELLYLFYQYTIWLIYHFINRQLVKALIVAWYKHNNISYTIPFADFVIWGCKNYTINYKQGKYSLDPRTNTDPRDFTPFMDPSLIPQSTYGFFVVYSNSTKVII